MSDDLLAALGHRRPAWFADANCVEHKDVDFHGRGPNQIARAIQICGRCLVRGECLAYALADPTLLGVWGGTDEAARRAMRRCSLKASGF